MEPLAILSVVLAAGAAGAGFWCLRGIRKVGRTAIDEIRSVLSETLRDVPRAVENELPNLGDVQARLEMLERTNKQIRLEWEDAFDRLKRTEGRVHKVKGAIAAAEQKEAAPTNRVDLEARALRGRFF